ncbi:MAG: hypothetical protein H6741_04250 [Alphaproteobacteria bacterium]|nr:hypothetical protein [Alphaproteobacteria bacterium]
MTEGAPLLRLTLALAAALLLGREAGAVPPPPRLPPQAEASQLQERTLEDWARMLRASDAADQRLAARELRRRVHSANRAAEHARPGSIQELETRQELAKLVNALERPCVVSLTNPEVARTCAQLLAALEIRSALPALEEALPQTERRRTQRAIEAAIAELSGLETEARP